MTQLFASASKLVLLIFALGGTAAFLIGKLSEANFMLLAIAVFSFYFGKSVPGGSDVTPLNPPEVQRETTIRETVTPAVPTDPAKK